MKAQRGVALITVLLVVAVVTVVCASMIARQQLSIRATSNQLQARQAWHYALGGEALAQLPPRRQVGGELLPQLGRRPAQQGGELPVLAAHRLAAVLDAAVILPPVEQGGDLPVHRRQKVGEVDAPAGKVLGKVPRLPLPRSSMGWAALFRASKVDT